MNPGAGSRNMSRVRRITQHKVSTNRHHLTKSLLMKKLTVFTLALLLAGAVSVRAADAKENYDKNCAKCHGEDGKGKTKMGEKLGVKDYTDAKVQADMKDDD